MDENELPTPDLKPKFDGPRLDDVLYLENNEPVGYGMDPSDGLPRPQPTHTVKDTESPLLHPDRFICMKVVDANGNELRPQCKHYRRQLLPWPEDKERNVCVRYCAALKNENGELFNVGDSEVLACEFRDPPDDNSSRLLDEHDQKVLEMQAAKAEEEETFDPLAELEKEND